MYILETNYGTLRKFNSLEEIADYFLTHTNNRGEIFFNGKRDSISYNVKEFTEDAILRDFIMNRMVKLVNREGYFLYKCKQLNE